MYVGGGSARGLFASRPKGIRVAGGGAAASFCDGLGCDCVVAIRRTSGILAELWPFHVHPCGQLPAAVLSRDDLAQAKASPWA
mmetsp:Transcript_30965/g.90249  ORF Transcript_30965/g.90249 Transcript_30965/m.90249 type:complete len:83 (+) Transcript_30965:171-419(+)